MKNRYLQDVNREKDTVQVLGCCDERFYNLRCQCCCFTIYNFTFLQYWSIKQINAFFQKLVDTIISHKQENVPMVILINDVNSVNRGRDYFSDLIDKLKAADFHESCGKFYFDYKIVNPAQRYGERHASSQTVFNLPKEFDGIYQPWHDCSSAQLLIEVQ